MTLPVCDPVGKQPDNYKITNVPIHHTTIGGDNLSGEFVNRIVCRVIQAIAVGEAVFMVLRVDACTFYCSLSSPPRHNGTDCYIYECQ